MTKTELKRSIEILCESFSAGQAGGGKVMTRLRFFEEILTGLNAVVFVYDIVNKRKVWSNGKYATVLGYDDEDFLKLSMCEVFQLVHPDDQGVIATSHEHFETASSDAYSTFYRIRHLQGHWVWMYYHFTILECSQDGKPTFILGAGFDFTEHIQSELHLKGLMAENRKIINEIRLKCLTKREKEVILYLISGQSCRQVAANLSISCHTVETHIKNIHRKLGVSTLAEVYSFAVECGLKH
jgi:PAS domain S-box-containing protein